MGLPKPICQREQYPRRLDDGAAVRQHHQAQDQVSDKETQHGTAVEQRWHAYKGADGSRGSLLLCIIARGSTRQARATIRGYTDSFCELCLVSAAVQQCSQVTHNLLLRSYPWRMVFSAIGALEEGSAAGQTAAEPNYYVSDNWLVESARFLTSARFSSHPSVH